ncbi:sarcoglycan alpha/epsilon, partial [Ostertagia ostertagi]
ETYTIDTLQATARKGQLFVYTLHSASFFSVTVDVKWSATLKNRPALPSWLHLVPSRHKALAYLVGTPVTGARQVTAHVLAKRLDTFKYEQRYIIINLEDDERYNRATQQVVEIHIENIEAEDLFADRNGLSGKLINSVREAFRGKDVHPYIYNIQPAFQVPLGKEHLFGGQKTGSLVSVGTQRGFRTNVHKLVHHLQVNPAFCKKRLLVVLNKYFSPTFNVDWCRTRIRNMTLQQAITAEPSALSSVDTVIRHKQPNAEVGATSEGYTFWESVLVFPLIAVFCIVLVLVLSLIFFGKREGQQWRDYKTAKEQLDEYVNVRQSQRHLRELSAQRQLLLMARGLHQSSRCGVHSFLQPKYKGAQTGNDSLEKFSKSGSKLEDINADFDHPV